MKYSVFNQTPNDATKEPMFFGQPVNVLRFDRQRYPFFEAGIHAKQLADKHYTSNDQRTGDKLGERPMRVVRFKASDKLRRQCKEHLSATTKS